MEASQAPEDTASDTSDGPPPWDQPVEVDNMAEVKYQGPVTIHKMIDPVPGPSFEDQANAMPKRDKLTSRYASQTRCSPGCMPLPPSW